MSFLPTFVAGQLVAGAFDTLDNFLTVIPQGQLDSIRIQATIEETHESRLNVTRHPVEDGADITDHSFLEPKEVIMHCGWSNSSPDALAQVINSGIQSFQSGGLSSLFSDLTAPNGDFVSGVYSQILALQATRQPFSIVTSLRSYDDMLIRHIRVTRDHKSVNALMVHVTCSQVILVSTSSTSVPPIANQLIPANTADFSSLGGIGLAPAAQPTAVGSLAPVLWPSLT